jgi:photosystem II stability/assembly factor-like uncharacterized protein
MKKSIFTLARMIDLSSVKEIRDNFNDQLKKYNRYELSLPVRDFIRYLVLVPLVLFIFLNESYAQPEWFKQTSGTTKQLYGVWFTNDSTGIVVGRGQTILRTTDAGNTWSPPTYPVLNSFLTDICFADAMNGWAVGYDGIILNTTDGGVTWTKQVSGGTYSFESLFSLNENIVYATSNIIKYTNDGGKTWYNQQTPNSTHIWDISFPNANEGFAVAGYCNCCIGGVNGAYIFHTTNGGGTWWLQKYDSTVVGYLGVCFINDSTGTVVGTGGTIMHTTDGGKTWNSQISGTTEDIWDVLYVNSNLAYAVGGNCSNLHHGIILCSENGGETWTKQDIPTDFATYRIFFINDSTGVAVGAGGTIMRTGDVPTKNQENDMLVQLSLSQNYPNPFNTTTSIRFQIPESYHVTLKVYNINGQEVATLVNEKMIPGSHEVTWDAEGIPAGVYFYKLQAGSITVSKKLVLIK